MEEKDAQGSLAESFFDYAAQPKLSDIDGRTSLVSSKTLRTPNLKEPATLGITPHDKQKSKGKYSRLRRELSMAIRAGTNDTVCVVTVLDGTTDSTQNNLECESGSHSASSDTAYEVTAAHTDGDGPDAMDIPKTLKQALSHDDAEFWGEAILDEVSNLEDVFSAFGPPVPREAGMSVTPTRFLFSKKIVSLAQRQQDAKSKAYKEIPVLQTMSDLELDYFM